MWKLEKNGDPKYFIEGPGRLTSALETLHAPKPSQAINAHEPKEKINGGVSSNPPPVQLKNNVMTCRTIVASDNDVSNGFVKDGKALPYVFEATESGLRKRSNKILPVCGVCGKKFVCVTTMKRHLVTHTGEKPFSCKVCGKQYTQKGNLRVHERTHRNDRPFECNICHQKFYRKEPMQKHQWRQHAIVHFKSRPSTQKEDEVSTNIIEEPVLAKAQSSGPPTQEIVVKPSSSMKPHIDSTVQKSEQSSSPLSVDSSSPNLTKDQSARVEQEQHKPCLKHKMKLAQAYLREQRELGENLSSSGRDIVGLLNLSLKEEPNSSRRLLTSKSNQCDGCRVSFKDSTSLDAHFQSGEDSPYKCCQCSQEFNQRSLLIEHQAGVHASNNLIKPAMTFTMQELIERGVERSMMKRADVGRFDGENEPQSMNLSLRSPSPSQPLDLSPAKSLDQSKEEILASRANNPLLNNRPYKEFKESSPTSSSSLSPVYKKQKTNEGSNSEEESLLNLDEAGLHRKHPQQAPIKLQSWKAISPYIKSDFVRSSDQMRLNNMERNRPQDGRTV